MKKLIGLVLVLIVAATAASAQITFRDVPADHWAAKAVYDLVRLGITQGYPDGTFRGTKNITRYETAMFLSKLASVAGAAGMEKLASELRAEIRALRAEIAALKRGVPGVAAAAPVSGSLKMSYLLGNLIASKDIAGTTMPRGPLTSYRLKTTLASNLGAGASVAVNLDTMDRGYFGGSENLVTSLLDASGTLKVDMGLDNPVDVKVTVGPGPQPINVVGGASKALAGAWFMRPYNGVGLATSIGGVELSGAYTALTQTAGDIGVNQLTGTVGYAFSEVPLLNKVKLAGTADYLTSQPLATPAGPIDLRAKILVATEPVDKVKVAVTLGCGTPQNSPHGYALTGELALADYFQTGTDITAYVHKVGTEYLDSRATLIGPERFLVGLDPFDRPIGNGTVAVGGTVVQTLADKVKLVGKGDVRMSGNYKYGSDIPQSGAAGEIGVLYDIAPSTVLDASYRVVANPSDTTDQTSDIAAVGLQYKF